MDERDWLAARFEEHRARLRAVAYRMLGSLAEVDDAVEETWLRLSRLDAAQIENLGGWLTTVLARVCLNMLDSRHSRREEPLEGYVPDPIVGRAEAMEPEEEALLADSVGLALLVVLQTLDPAERLVLVLHDMFDVPFDEIAAMVGRSPAAARQLASRARRRVKGAAPAPDDDPGRQRAVVDAFLAAARDGDFAALLALLDPNVMLRADVGALPRRAPRVIHGAAAVAEQALAFGRQRGRFSRRVRVNGAAGIVAAPGGRPVAVLSFAVRQGRIVEIDILADPARLSRLKVTQFQNG